MDWRIDKLTDLRKLQNIFKFFFRFGTGETQHRRIYKNVLTPGDLSGSDRLSGESADLL